MLKIGLTGGIGSGKSTVARIFEVLGVPVYYADQASKRLYHTNAVLKASLIEHFGEAVYENGILNRQYLAGLVFKDPEQLALLNRLVHPPTIADAIEWMERQTAPYVIKEAALIFESGSGRGLDFIIGVHAPNALRIHRVMERDGISREDVISRASKQLDETMKMRLCDAVITNDELHPLIPQVLVLHQRFLSGEDLGASAL